MTNWANEYGYRGRRLEDEVGDGVREDAEQFMHKLREELPEELPEGFSDEPPEKPMPPRRDDMGCVRPCPNGRACECGCEACQKPIPLGPMDASQPSQGTQGFDRQGHELPEAFAPSSSSESCKVACWTLVIAGLIGFVTGSLLFSEERRNT